MAVPPHLLLHRLPRFPRASTFRTSSPTLSLPYTSTGFDSQLRNSSSRISAEPDQSLAQSHSHRIFSQVFFMQSEPTAVSEYTPTVDLPPAQRRSTQHGNDIADGPVSDSLHGESAEDSHAVLGQSTTGPTCLSLNDTAAAPPSSPASRVVQHENAGMPGRRGVELDFRVVTSGSQPELGLVSLPNGKLKSISPRSAQTYDSRRGPHPYPVPSAASIACSHHPSVSSVPCSCHYTSCLENCVLPVLSGSPRRRRRAPVPHR